MKDFLNCNEIHIDLLAEIYMRQKGVEFSELEGEKAIAIIHAMNCLIKRYTEVLVLKFNDRLEYAYSEDYVSFINSKLNQSIKSLEENTFELSSGLNMHI